MADTIINGRVKNKSDTAANWASANPIILLGEIGVESDTGNIKIGDGVTAWNMLPYGADVTKVAMYGGTTATDVADTEYIPVSVDTSTSKKITWANVKVALAAIFAPKATTVIKTLTAAGWSGGAQVINDAAISSAIAPGSLKIAQSANGDEVLAFGAAIPQITTQTIGSITVTARGVVPTIDIPVALEVRG